MKQMSTKMIGLIASTIILFTACSKDPVIQPERPEQEEMKDLVIHLNNYLPTAKLDSAIAIWEVAGTTQKVKLQVKNNKLFTSLASFDYKGTGKLAVQLFTQIHMDQIPLQWENGFTYTLNPTVALELAAPTDIKDPSWSPRLVYNSEIHDANFLALIAIRPEDTYFELRGVEPRIAKRIEIVRSFFNNDTTTLVASRGWIGQAKDLDEKGNVVNRDHFSALVEQIDGRPWNILKVRATFFAQLNPGEAYEAETEHNRP